MKYAARCCRSAPLLANGVKALLLVVILLGLAWYGKFYITQPTWYASYYGKGMFDDMTLEEAAATSSEFAGADFRHGRYRQLVWGLRYANKYDEYLLERYQVTTVPVAGCLVGKKDEVVANSYNATMGELLMVKYGRDVFEEAWRATRK